jgi:hypothetical protein
MSSALLERETAIAEPENATWAPKVSYFDRLFRGYIAGELDRLRHLDAGWDGYRAIQIAPRIIDAARTFVFAIPENIAPRPSVVPLINGTLQLEWVEGEKSLEFEFEDENTVHFLQWDPANNTAEEDSFDVGDLAKAESLIRWFTSADVP